jgi:hypothetical protein
VTLWHSRVALNCPPAERRPRKHSFRVSHRPCELEGKPDGVIIGEHSVSEQGRVDVAVGARRIGVHLQLVVLEADAEAGKTASGASEVGGGLLAVAAMSRRVPAERVFEQGHA